MAVAVAAVAKEEDASQGAANSWNQGAGDHLIARTTMKTRKKLFST